jgi:CrcB protein
LGSFSTFSTFMAELFVVLRECRWSEAVLLGGGSVLGGLIAMAMGLAMGAQP